MTIGIFGGTFDPVHIGHVQLAEGVLESVDRLIVMVAAEPPHKRAPHSVSDADRLQMAQLAFAELPHTSVSDMELLREGKSYSADTLEALHRANPNDRLAFVMGGDMLLYFRKWRRFEDILKLARLLVIPRPETDVGLAEAAESLRRDFGADVRILPVEADAVSSTEVRRRISEGRPISALVPAEVEDYIYANGLYLPDDVRRAFERLRASVSPKRFEHTLGVVRLAAELSERYGADPSKARLAALLHDCGKLSERREEAYRALGIEPDEYERAMPKIFHATAGRVIAEKLYGVTDREVLDAIAAHTVGRLNMSVLDKVIFVADAAEAGRRYEYADEVRRALERDLDDAVLTEIAINSDYCLKKGEAIHPVTLAEQARLKELRRNRVDG